jgi:hypothetical protein
MLDGNVNTIKKHTQSLLEAGLKLGVEVNIEKTKYMIISHHQNTEQNHSLLIADRPFEKVKIFGNSSNKSKLHSQRN